MDLAPHLGDARDAVRGIADQGEVVGDGRWADAELLVDSSLVQGHVPPSVKTDHPAVLDHLSQVLVRRADDNLLDTSGLTPLMRSRSDSVVGLELDHRPDDKPQRRSGPLRQIELGHQVLGDAGAGLIPAEQVVPEGLDDVVEGAGDVGDVVFT